MMRYLDNELDAEAVIHFDEHLKDCTLCASFVERSRKLDELLESTLAPSSDSAQSADFVNRLIDRLDGAGTEGVGEEVHETATSTPIRKLLWPLSAAAAVLAFLLWAFFATDQRGGSKDTRPEPLLSDAGRSLDENRIQTASHLRTLPVSGLMRDRAYAELSQILTSLDQCPEDELIRRFEEKTQPLSERNWRADAMLVGALRREEGPALRCAVRLVARLPRTSRLPDASHALERLVHEDRCASSALAALRALGTERAIGSLGRILHDRTYRTEALGLLSSMNSSRAPDEVVACLRGEMHRGTLSPFGIECVQALSRMGETGAAGIVEACALSRSSRGFARALALPTDEFASQLLKNLHRLEGSTLEAGLALASALRINDAVEVMRTLYTDRDFKANIPHLVAAVGGPAALRTLVDLYQEPVSLRERKRLIAALCGIFEHYPDELDDTLAALFEEIEPGADEVFLEMLSHGETDGACSALSWIATNSPRHAPDASLCLARTGSDAALDEVLRILGDPRLSRKARVAAAAAAFHLAGPSILDRIMESLEADQAFLSEGGSPLPGSVDPTRRSRLTRNGFRKIQDYILTRIE